MCELKPEAFVECLIIKLPQTLHSVKKKVGVNVVLNLYNNRLVE